MWKARQHARNDRIRKALDKNPMPEMTPEMAAEFPEIAAQLQEAKEALANLRQLMDEEDAEQ